MSVRAPSGGYDFSKKRDYRRRVWAQFAVILKEMYGSGALENRHAMLMPSKDGAEIEYALRVGFREHNLHIVDDNPAVVATLKRRYRNLQTYGVAVGRAVERARSKGVKLSCLNMDFTSQASSKLARDIQRLIYAGAFGQSEIVGNEIRFGGSAVDRAFDSHCVVSVNMLAGRERDQFADIMAGNWQKLRQGLEVYLSSEREEQKAKLTAAAEWLGAAPDNLIPVFMEGVLGFSENEALVRLVELTKGMPDTDAGRAFWVYSSLIQNGMSGRTGPGLPKNRRLHVFPLRAFSYVSTNGQKFLTSIWLVSNPFLFCRDYILRDVASSALVEKAFRKWEESENRPVFR